MYLIFVHTKPVIYTTVRLTWFNVQTANWMAFLHAWFPGLDQERNGMIRSLRSKERKCDLRSLHSRERRGTQCW